MSLHTVHNGTLKKVATAHYWTGSQWKAVKEAWRWTGSAWQKVYESIVFPLWPLYSWIGKGTTTELDGFWNKEPGDGVRVVNGEAVAGPGAAMYDFEAAEGIWDSSPGAIWKGPASPNQSFRMDIVMGRQGATMVDNQPNYSVIHVGPAIVVGLVDTLYVQSKQDGFSVGIMPPWQVGKTFTLIMQRVNSTTVRNLGFDNEGRFVAGNDSDTPTNMSLSILPKVNFMSNQWANTPGWRSITMSAWTGDLELTKHTQGVGKNKTNSSGWKTPPITWNHYEDTGSGGVMNVPKGKVFVKASVKQSTAKEWRVVARVGTSTQVLFTRPSYNNAAFDVEYEFTSAGTIWLETNGYTGAATDIYNLYVEPRI